MEGGEVGVALLLYVGAEGEAERDVVECVGFLGGGGDGGGNGYFDLRSRHSERVIGVA